MYFNGYCLCIYRPIGSKHLQLPKQQLRCKDSPLKRTRTHMKNNAITKPRWFNIHISQKISHFPNQRVDYPLSIHVLSACLIFQYGAGAMNFQLVPTATAGVGGGFWSGGLFFGKILSRNERQKLWKMVVGRFRSFLVPGLFSEASC